MTVLSVIRFLRAELDGSRHSLDARKNTVVGWNNHNIEIILDY